LLRVTPGDLHAADEYIYTGIENIVPYSTGPREDVSNTEMNTERIIRVSRERYAARRSGVKERIKKNEVISNIQRKV
jgi:hypothetical protein